MQVQEQGKAVARTSRRAIMQRSSSELQDRNNIEATVIIHQPVEKVFEFYSDFRNLPSFLGDVLAVEKTGPATSRWTIQGPLGIQAHWNIQVTEERPNELIRYETLSGPGLRTCWEINFASPRNGETEVREVMKMPLGRAGRAALALIGKFPVHEVASNLQRLKQIMETGKVNETSYSVKGKFGH